MLAIIFLLKNSRDTTSLINFFVCLHFLFALHSIWYLSSLTRDGTCTPSMKAWSINCWITRDVPVLLFSVHQL